MIYVTEIILLLIEGFQKGSKYHLRDLLRDKSALLLEEEDDKFVHQSK